MTRDEYNKMDVVKAITTWNEENKLDDGDDLYIFDNDRLELNKRFCGAYDAIETDGLRAVLFLCLYTIPF